MASLIPDPEQLRFEQRCLERFERQARALEEREAALAQALASCQQQLTEAEDELHKQKCHQEQVDALLADARTRLMQLEHFEMQARHSLKTQLKLPIRELMRRLLGHS
ncbi:MAG: hypothetical protein VKM98_07535 [Cyanobacteriota bacterium]|nr:hypothetical protein [Cyanobacteriota bacterium]